MSDSAWRLIIGILFVVLGFLLIWMGFAIWKKQRTDLIISYHMDRVSDENRQAYCRLFGIGCLLPGAGFALSGVWTTLTAEMISWLPMAAGLAAGLLLLAAAVLRYNR